jgi:hypothetical protein
MKKFGKTFKKVRNNVIQSINSEGINSYLKVLSENLSYIMKKDKELLIKDNDYGKYENSYDFILKNENNNNNDILFLALVTFHHRQGGVIECTFPQKEQIISEGKLNSLIDEKNENLNKNELVLDFILNKLINYCLIDGIHLVDTDSSFFIIHELPKVLYCFTYYIQKKAKDNEIEDNFQENIRGCIQKAFCVVSTTPIFNNLTTYQNYIHHISRQMNLYMNQKSLNDKSVLNDAFNKLNTEYIKEKKYLLNIKKAYYYLKEDFLILFKLISLEKRIIIFSQIPSNVSYIILSLLSIFPGFFIDGKSHFDEQNGTPLKIVHDKYLIFPLFSLYNLDYLLDQIKNNEINYLIGTTNNIIINNKNLKYDCLVNLDEHKIIYNENISIDIKTINGREKKLLATINNIINKDNIKLLNENYENEPWIVDYNKKNNEKIYYIKKNIRLYYIKIIYDISYLIHEIKNKINNSAEEQEFLIFQQNNISKNYKKFLDNEDSQININIPENIKALPNLENMISDPYIYILYTILPIKFDYLFIEAEKNKNEVEKKRETILAKLNNLAFLTEWTKTRNFIKWYLSYDEGIIRYSSLNASLSRAKLYDYDDNLFEGDMQLGRKNGVGKLYYYNEGMIYNGEFKNDEREGRGKLYSNDGKYSYVGDWMNNQMEGNGILISDKLGKYSGLFHKDFFEGKGHLIDINNNEYKGDFHKGFKQGKGELILNNGNVYIGAFKFDKYNGKGELKDSEGNILEKGEFKDGVLFKRSKSIKLKEEEKKKKEQKDKEEEKIEEKIEEKEEEKIEEKIEEKEEDEIVERMSANPLHDENKLFNMDIKELNDSDEEIEKEEKIVSNEIKENEIEENKIEENK